MELGLEEGHLQIHQWTRGKRGLSTPYNITPYKYCAQIRTKFVALLAPGQYKTEGWASRTSSLAQHKQSHYNNIHIANCSNKTAALTPSHFFHITVQMHLADPSFIQAMEILCFKAQVHSEYISYNLTEHLYNWLVYQMLFDRSCAQLSSILAISQNPYTIEQYSCRYLTEAIYNW